ncbi:unnamed protein product [Closterium sp. NIES-65]|nr:unnamed protein product [Closterium sp. NIES-65]
MWNRDYAGAVACAIAMVWEVTRGSNVTAAADNGHLAARAAGCYGEPSRLFPIVSAYVVNAVRKRNARELQAEDDEPQVVADPKVVATAIVTGVVNKVVAKSRDLRHIELAARKRWTLSSRSTLFFFTAIPSDAPDMPTAPDTRNLSHRVLSHPIPLPVVPPPAFHLPPRSLSHGPPPRWSHPPLPSTRVPSRTGPSPLVPYRTGPSPHVPSCAGPLPAFIAFDCGCIPLPGVLMWTSGFPGNSEFTFHIGGNWHARLHSSLLHQSPHVLSPPHPRSLTGRLVARVCPHRPPMDLYDLEAPVGGISA